MNWTETSNRVCSFRRIFQCYFHGGWNFLRRRYGFVHPWILKGRNGTLRLEAIDACPFTSSFELTSFRVALSLSSPYSSPIHRSLRRCWVIFELETVDHFMTWRPPSIEGSACIMFLSVCSHSSIFTGDFNLLGWRRHSSQLLINVDTIVQYMVVPSSDNSAS